MKNEAIKELLNRDWLYKKYVEEKISTPKIAKSLGCGEASVVYYLKKFGIPIRNRSEATLLTDKPSKYILLNYKDWLYQKYIVEKLGTKQICKLVGAKTPNSISQALRKYEIPVRTIGEGLTCNREDDTFIFNDKTKQVIEGCLLGDGSLRVWKKESKASKAAFTKRNKFYDHVLYVANEIFTSKDRAKERIKECNALCSWDKTLPYTSFELSTYTYDELTEMHRKWYPESNNYIKLVPKDLELTPITLLHWFMDDGFSYRRKREKTYKESSEGNKLKRNYNQIVIGLCSESFFKEDQEMLIGQMNNKFGLSAYLKKSKGGTGYRIFLPQSQAQKFFELIGPCPVPSMQYKWKTNN